MANGKPPEKPERPVNYRSSSYSDNYKRKYDDYFAKGAKPEIKNPEPVSVKREYKKLGKANGEKVLEDIERIVVSRRAKKIEKVIIAIIYIAVLAVALYFILATFFPEYLPFSGNVYEIKASDSRIFNTLSSFYIDDQSALGDKKIVNSMSVLPIINTKKFNFVFAPKENIPSNKKSMFYMDLVLNQAVPGDIYVDDKLVFPNLKDYALLKETPTDYIYVKKENLPYLNENSLINYGNTEDYVYDNMQGESIWATRQLGSPEPDIEDYNKTPSLINGTFRGDLKLAIYSEGELNIDFIKQDLNGYLGEDTYTVTVTDSYKNNLYTKVFGDDGDKKNSGKLGNEQKFSINLNELKSGIYYVSFVKDSNNDGADSTLKNIQIDSNKVLIVGTFLPIQPLNFYTKADSIKQIGFYYWHTEKNQLINITGTKNPVIDLNEGWLGKRYDLSLTKGEYDINLEKGDLWIYNDFSAPAKENWFDIPRFQQEKFDNPNIIVIDKVIYDKNNNILSYSKSINTNKLPVKVSLRALETNSAMIKSVRVVVR